MKYSKRKRLVKKIRFWKKRPMRVVFTTVISLWLLCLLLMSVGFYWDSEPWAHRGQFGDMFGAINALFSGFAFGGIILTILLQRQELKLQRKELSLTRQELQDTRKEFETQNETLKFQRFESTLFNMLSLHQSIKEGEQFAKYIHTFKTKMTNAVPSAYETSHLTKFKTLYDDHIRTYSADIIVSSYLLSLSSIYSFIQVNKLLQENQRQDYLTILRNTISIGERRFLFYHLTLAAHDAPVETLQHLELNMKILGSLTKNDLVHSSHLNLVEVLPN